MYASTCVHQSFLQSDCTMQVAGYNVPSQQMYNVRNKRNQIGKRSAEKVLENKKCMRFRQLLLTEDIRKVNNVWYARPMRK